MKILLMTLEPPLDASLAVRGNVIRAAQLEQALSSAGHRVQQVFRRPYDDSPVADSTWMYRNGEELQGLLERFEPDAILLGYWALAEDLPEQPAQPVIMDFIAPRPLEALFEPEDTRDLSLQRLHACLARADFFLVGNQRQQHLLVPYLLQAGIDVREDYPVAVVPIAAAPAVAEVKSPPDSQWIIAGGGVRWNWRRQQAYIDALQQWCHDHATAGARPHLPKPYLVLFGGDYPRIHQPGEHELQGWEPGRPVSSLGLQKYADYCRFLRTRVHIGLELAEFNIERYFSQSFRAMEYLRHGIPVIANSYSELAGKISDYQAGWAVDAPEQAPTLLQDLMQQPQRWREAAGNALRLCREVFDPEQCAGPLLEFLRQPRRAAHIEPLLPAASERPDSTPASAAGAGETVQAPAAPRDEDQALYDPRRALGRARLANLYGQLRARIPYRGSLRELPRKWFYQGCIKLASLCAGRAAAGEPGNVVIVTRADLYPSDHGGAVKIVETARALSKTGREVAIVTSERHRYWLYRDGERHERRLPLWLRLISLPRQFSTLVHLSRDVPRSNQFLYLALSDNSFLWRTVHVARKINANVYQAEFPAYARPCFFARRVRGGRVVIVEHNVEYQRLRAQEKKLTEAQYRRLKALEIDFCNLADAVICVSKPDRATLLDDGVAEHRLRVIPHGVDLAAFDGEETVDVRTHCGWRQDRPVLVYHGTYQYPPNLTAVRMLAEEVLPRLHRQGIRPGVLAIGKMPPAEPIHEDIVFTGSVDRVAGWLRGADVAVVPLLDGGGTRMKIIDYFACRLPVVSTRKGIEGIEAHNGREAIVTDDWDEMAEAIAGLLNDRRRSASMAAAGRAIAQQLDWAGLAERYLQVYRNQPAYGGHAGAKPRRKKT